jgi:pimeloyl-ACP methyl ester carboxylesterase
VFDWRHQIAYLSAAGYGVLAPDLLGFGATDKPSAIEDYKFSKMSGHLAEILVHEGLDRVIGVGHDW